MLITSIIVSKLKSLDISHATIKWILDFLTNRQRAKLGEDCFSEWGNVPAGVPQGNKTWALALCFDDLRPCVNDEIKFVDDFIISESLPKFASSQIQDSQGRSKLDNWGGGGLIFIYSGSAQLISFEINCFYGL